MSTRAKRGLVPECEADDLQDGSDQQGAISGHIAGQENVAELSKLLQNLMQQQAERDSKLEQEHKRQEDRWRQIRHQFAQLQQQVQHGNLEHQLLEVQASTSASSRAPTPEPPVSTQESNRLDLEPVHQRSEAQLSTLVRHSGWKGPKMQPYNEGEDIEHYLITFERIAHACQWPRDEWALHLAPLLAGKARSAYVAMDIDDTMDYAKVKCAVLQKYEISVDTYRMRFRSSTFGAEETPRELQVRLKELYIKWMNPETKTKDQIGDAIIMEQFLKVLNPDLRTWVKERNPKTSKEAAELAEAFLAARRPSKVFTPVKSNSNMPLNMLGGGPDLKVKHTRQNWYNSDPARSETKNKTNKACHLCGQIGHLKAQCTKMSASKNYMCSARQTKVSENRKNEIECQQHEPSIGVFVEDKPCVALLDSGSNRSLVRQDSLPRDVIFSGATVDVCCIHGDKVSYPVAEVAIEVEGQCYTLSVGVLQTLPYQVVLGRDLPILTELIAKHSCQTETIESLLAVTRSKAKEQQVNASGWDDLPFANEDAPLDESSTHSKPKKSKRQRRHEKVKGTRIAEHILDPLKTESLPSASQVARLQKEDLTLKPLFSKCVPESTTVEGRQEVFVVKGDLLHRRSKIGDQLVIPQSLRSTILKMSHSIPWAGHLGQSKTFSRMIPRFYWPQQFSDTVQYCKACPQCQLTAPGRKSDRAPLISMPIIDTPFSRIAMDIVGPLEQSKAGHKYILVVCDYATKYPEAFPLKKIKARQIVNCLIQLFSRVGIPKEIITDQGTNFTSKMLKEVYSLLGIQGVKTSPYHPQTDGLVERFNKTLKSMLRKFVSETGSDWDQWLPFLLFAYREVPQSSTGFSPFQLLYGHPVRGPMDVLKEAWEGSMSEQRFSELSYVLKMRDKLEHFQELANNNLAHAQQQQKQRYDKVSRRRVFREGQKVLLLLPTSESSLLAKWQGPYEITKKTGPVTYELHLPDRRKNHQVFHVNLLKEWTAQPQDSTSMWACTVVDEEEPQEQYFPSSAVKTVFPDLDHLPLERRQEVQSLMTKELFSLKPGRTHLSEHKITLHSPDQRPIRDTTCRIPAKLLPELKSELEEMLAAGIIEPSHSEWCSPVVLVPKKDDPKLRFCVNFSKLNSVSAFDPYPMPRVDELIDRLGNAKFLTTLDLCKGYWQVPLTNSSKDLTTFRVPSGLFRFTVMPFGLHGAPATFQRLVDRVLKGAEQYAAAYIDDIVVYSGTWEDHLKHLADVFRRITNAGLVINGKKCHIAKPEVQYLGYVIGGGGIRPQVGKVDAVAAAVLPNTKKRLRSFLGLVGWYRRLIPNFSSRAALLTDMTRKSSPTKVRWTKDAENAFNDLKDCLCQKPVLQCPDFNLSFTVQTDASEVGLGAVLLQGEEGQQLPVQYISRKLFPREMRYSTIEKEALAIKWALDTLRYYLVGKEFVLETDHRALQWIHNMKDTNARITRWYLSLQPFRFQVQYRPGHKNVIADFLSRDSEE